MSTDDSRHSDLAVMDASEYKQKRRLRRVLDAHDAVEEATDETYALFASGQIGEAGKNIRVLRAVQAYIREVYTLLQEYGNDLADDERNQYWEGSEVFGPLGTIAFESQDDRVLWGLRDILHAKELYEEEWTERVRTRHGPSRVVERQATHTVPERASMRAYLLVNTFLTDERDVVGISFSDELPTWGFEEVHDDGDS
jgi:hypothetical protein